MKESTGIPVIWSTNSYSGQFDRPVSSCGNAAGLSLSRGPEMTMAVELPWRKESNNNNDSKHGVVRANNKERFNDKKLAHWAMRERPWIIDVKDTASFNNGPVS